MKVKAIIMTAVFAITSAAVFAQNETQTKHTQLFKNDLGIDVANIITVLSKRNESYLIMYKRYITDAHAIRFGLNFDAGTESDDGTYMAGRIGYQYNFPLVNQRWLMYVGSDFSFYSSSSNFQPNTVRRFGILPIVGMNYFFSKSFSLSTEISVNLLYTEYRNPDSFDPEANTDVYDVSIGSVGMIILSYHFDVPFRSSKK